MRTYRTQIRLIQVSVILTLIVMLVGAVSVWTGSENEPIDGEEPIENGTLDPAEEDPDGNAPPANTKIVCLGDSFTYGYPGETEDAWPRHVADSLSAEVINSGKVHQNTSDLLKRYEDDVLAHEPGRVVIFAGVGDALRGISLEEYQGDLIELVEKAEADGIRPILALPVPFPGTEELNKAYREWESTYAEEKQIQVLDFSEVLFDSDGKILANYSDDGKYPNKEGYRAMGDYASLALQ